MKVGLKKPRLPASENRLEIAHLWYEGEYISLVGLWQTDRKYSLWLSRALA